MKANSFMALAAAALLGTSAAHAQITNPNFDTNLSGWTLAGDVAFRDQFVFLTNAILNLPGDDGAVNFNYSGIDIVDSFTLEGFAGLGAGALDPDSGNSVFAFEGSALKQTFNVQAGAVINFSWQLFTNEIGGDDFAFVAINGILVPLATSADALDTAGSYGYDSQTSTGFFTSAPFASAQSATLTFGVVDGGLDSSVSSALKVDSVTAVPEPSTFGLLTVAALYGMNLRRRRQA